MLETVLAQVQQQTTRGSNPANEAREMSATNTHRPLTTTNAQQELTMAVANLKA
jgi:hypothetical protein